MSTAENKYKKNYLTSVIFKLNISNLIDLNHTILVKIQEELIAIFSKYEKVINKGGILNFNENTGSASIQEFDTNLHVFSSNDGFNILSIEEKSISFETSKYIDFDNFNNIVTQILTTILRQFPNISFNRLGLRYINQIVLQKGNPLDWENYISSDAIHSLNKFYSDKSKLSRCMSQLVYNFDDYQMNVNYGIYNGDFPSRVHRKEFIIDLDCYLNDFNNSEIKDTLIKFNHKIKSEFERFIMDGLRNEMESI